MVAHLAAWLPFVAGAVRLVRQGWRPVGDEAAIAVRSWNSLTAHGPMVGQATRLGHGVFDPGPLEYWLLAIPVHLDTVHGVMWGAVICCLAACSLAIEAAWSVLGAAGGLCASGFIVGLVLWTPDITLPPGWNPWFGVVFFTAALAAAWAVMSGRRGWWPGLVITASIAAQSHLMFTVPSGALAVLALIVGLADTARARSRYWWVLIGLLAGAACWSAPLIQQFTSRKGNLGLLLRSGGSVAPGARTGGVFSLKALSAAMGVPPLWWKSRIVPSAIFPLISHRSAGFAVAALILIAVAGITAVRPLRCRPLASLATVTLVISLGSLVTYSGIPMHSGTLLTLSYLIVLLFPVGVLSWLVVGSWAVFMARLISGRVAAARPARTRVLGAARAGPVAGLAASALVAAGVVLALVRQGPVARQVTHDSAMPDSVQIAGQIARDLPGQPIVLSVYSAGSSPVARLTLGVIYELTPRGFHAEVEHPGLARELGNRYVYHGGRIPHVKVRVLPRGISVTVIRPAGPAGHG